MFDPSDRIQKINEAFVVLSEKIEKPKHPTGGVDRSAPPSQRTPEDNDFLTKQREYNLQNQQGIQNFNPNAPQQMYAPSWDVKGKERREQMRAYLNYIRADPERLARYRAQYNDRETHPVASFAGRPESEVQSRLAAYERQQALNRAAKIAQHSPGLSEPLVAAAEASAEARAAERKLGDVIRSTKSLAQIKAENLKNRQELEDKTRREFSRLNAPAYSEMTPTPAEQSEIDARLLTKGTGDMESRRASQLSRQGSLSTPKAPEQPQGGYEFYNRQTGQIERSDAPGVDRVFRDPSGKAYRIEGGSGRKVYV